MRLYFIRHGQSENNLLWSQTRSWKGRTEDPDLTPTGRQQAEVLARFLQQHTRSTAPPASDYNPQNVHGFALTHLYCSLMIRAVATGNILARALNLPLVAWEELHETGGINRLDGESGERIGLPGKNRAYFERHHPDLILPASLGEEGWWNRPFEAYEERPLRARRFLEELLERHGNTDDRVAVISHGGFYNYLLQAILEMPGGEGIWFSLNNAAMTRLDFEAAEAWVSYMNRLDYMPRELIT